VNRNDQTNSYDNDDEGAVLLVCRGSKSGFQSGMESAPQSVPNDTGRSIRQKSVLKVGLFGNMWFVN
jgi:hypothetical protein